MPKEMLQCYNKGCGKKFDPDNNKSDSCRYHPGPPYFHDAYKIWNCCNKKSTDFTTWLSFEGCTLGKHNPVKPEDCPPKTIEKQQEDVEKTPEKVIVWNGLNKPAPREEVPRKMSKLKLEPTESLLNAIEKHNQQNSNNNDAVHVGVSCKNSGCEKKYEGKHSDEEECVYHNGVPVFHEGMKYWSCCQRKTSNFNAFLEQKGCVVGRHCWSKNERVNKVREDWFSRSGFIHLNVYCKGALPAECDIESDGFILTAKVVHGFGTKETVLNYELFGQIDVPESKVIVGERKLEIIMKQKDCAGWPRLTYDPPVDCDSKLSV
uniref:Cysteine and histidine-rich domain-containing protein 1 n=1 Tax=Syphacia muris TaxID=451379 RepID=A0A0N5APL8_9BILA